MTSVVLTSVYIQITYPGAAITEEARTTTQAKTAVNFIVIIDICRTEIRISM